MWPLQGRLLKEANAYRWNGSGMHPRARLDETTRTGHTEALMSHYLEGEKEGERLEWFPCRVEPAVHWHGQSHASSKQAGPEAIRNMISFLTKERDQNNPLNVTTKWRPGCLICILESVPSKSVFWYIDLKNRVKVQSQWTIFLQRNEYIWFPRP